MKLEVGYLLLFVSLFNTGLSLYNDEYFETLLKSGTNRQTHGGDSFRQPPVTVLEVRREAVGDRIKLTVKYRANEATVDVLWEHAWENIEGLTDTVVEDDVLETSILLDGYELAQERYRDVESFYYNSYALAKVNLYTYQSGSYEILTLSIRYDEGDYVERDIPSLLLEIEPVHYFFYNEGQDFTFEIKKKPRLNRWDNINFELTTYLLDPDTGRVVFNDNDELFELVSTETFPDFEKQTMKIKTSEYMTRGILGFTVLYTANYAPALIEKIKRTRQVELNPRQVDYLGVQSFPYGYLEFVDSFGPDSRLRDGHIELLCRPDVPCLLECQAVGEDIESVTMRRLKADGTTELLDNISEMAVLSEEYMMGRRARIVMDAMAGQTQTIQCVAEKVQGTVKTMEATWDLTRLEAERQYFWPN